MNRRIQEKKPAPEDEEILARDNVPGEMAARERGWECKNGRAGVRASGVHVGVAVMGEKKALYYNISPGGLVKYKREGAPVMSYETLVMMVKEAVAGVITPEVESLRADLFN